MKKKILLLVLIIAFGISVSAVAQEEIELTVWEWDMTERPEAIEAVFEKFEETHPNIKVDIQTYDWNNIKQKSLTAGEAGNMPDVVQISGGWMQTMARNGYLENLDPFIENEDNDYLDSFLLAKRDPWTGNYNYLPFRNNLYGMYVIEEYMNEAGYDTVPSTWKEVEDLLNNVDDDLFGLTDGVANDNNLAAFLFASRGVKYENSEGVSTLGSEEAIEAIKYMKELFTKYAPDNVAVYGAKESRDVFLSGRAVLAFEGSWMNSILENSLVEDLTWIPAGIPVTEGEPARAIMGSEVYGIGKGTEHPEAAWELVKFLTGPEAGKMLVEDYGFMPNHKSHLELDVLYEDPKLKPFIEHLNNAEVTSFNWNKTNSFYSSFSGEIYQSILMNEVSPEEGMKMLEERINEQLETF